MFVDKSESLLTRKLNLGLKSFNIRNDIKIFSVEFIFIKLKMKNRISFYFPSYVFRNNFKPTNLLNSNSH